MYKMTTIKNHILKTITEFSLFVYENTCCPVFKKCLFYSKSTSLSAEHYNLTHCACNSTFFKT